MIFHKNLTLKHLNVHFPTFLLSMPPCLLNNVFFIGIIRDFMENVVTL